MMPGNLLENRHLSKTEEFRKNAILRQVPKSVPGFLVCIVSLVTIVVIVLFLEINKQHTIEQETRETFQFALGGIGTGAATIPAWNFGDYDSRLQPGAYDRSYPIPGGYSYSPDRLTMITGFQGQ